METTELDDSAALIARKGNEHERAYLDRLRAEGRVVVDIAAENGSTDDRVTRTLAAMRGGVEVIYQATLRDGPLFGHADFALRSADVALVASGTATLEAAMLGCPQVVSYRVTGLTAMIVKRKLNSRFVSLPNIIAGDWCVPELLQDAATVEALTSALGTLIEQSGLRAQMQAAYATMGEALRAPENAGHDALAMAVLAQLKLW